MVDECCWPTVGGGDAFALDETAFRLTERDTHKPDYYYHYYYHYYLLRNFPTFASQIEKLQKLNTRVLQSPAAVAPIALKSMGEFVCVCNGNGIIIRVGLAH